MPSGAKQSVFAKQSLRGNTAGGYSMQNIGPQQHMDPNGQIIEDQHDM